MSNKVRIAQKGVVSGATSFFRNRPLFDTVLRMLSEELGLTKAKILIHSCSVGAEVYSLLIRNEIVNGSKLSLEVYATDFEESYVQIARGGVYGVSDVQGILDEEAKYFNISESSASIVPDIYNKVTFLPASDFRRFDTEEIFDVVFILNSLCYVSGRDQAKTFDLVRKYNKHLLVTSSFHQDQIKSDMTRNGYIPVPNNQELIHDSWSFRLRPKDTLVTKTQIHLANLYKKIVPPRAGGLHITSSIPPFSRIKDFKYKYCAVFKKSGG